MNDVLVYKSISSGHGIYIQIASVYTLRLKQGKFCTEYNYTKYGHMYIVCNIC